MLRGPGGSVMTGHQKQEGSTQDWVLGDWEEGA